MSSFGNGVLLWWRVYPEDSIVVHIVVLLAQHAQKDIFSFHQAGLVTFVLEQSGEQSGWSCMFKHIGPAEIDSINGAK